MLTTNSFFPSSGELFSLYSLAILNFLVGCIIFTALMFFPNIKCNSQAPWWRNQAIKTDLFYVLLNPVFKLLLRFLPVAVIVVPFLLFMPVEDIYAYLANGRGPLAQYSLSTQCVIFLLSLIFSLLEPPAFS